jgi:hypothetical protein
MVLLMIPISIQHLWVWQNRLVGQFVVPMQIYSYEVFPNNQKMFEDLLNLKIMYMIQKIILSLAIL